MMKPRNSERVQFSHHPNRGKKKKKRKKKELKPFHATTEIYPGCLYRTNLFYFDRGSGGGGGGETRVGQMFRRH